MEQSMKNSGILLTINLKGALIGQPIHNQLQEVKVDISPDPKKIIYTTQRICHVDRISVACHKKTLITEWFEILKKELEIQGYEVGDIYPFKDPVLHIKWNNTIE